MSLQHIGTVKFAIPNWVNVKTEDGRGFQSVEDGQLIADLHISVDLQALAAALGRKAIRNKARRSKLQSGAIVVEAVNIGKKSKAA